MKAKEGSALNNGTQVMTGIGTLVLLAAERAVDVADTVGAMTLEGLRGTSTPRCNEPVRSRGKSEAPNGCPRSSPAAKSGSPTGGNSAGHV